MEMQIYLYPDSRAICPQCSGVIRTIGEILICHDCRQQYQVTGPGITSHAVTAVKISAA